MVLFVVIIVVSAKHAGVLPAVHIDYAGETATTPTSSNESAHDIVNEVDVFEGQLAPLESFIAFWACMLVPLAFYALDMGERLVLALNCCGQASVVVTRAKVCYRDPEVQKTHFFHAGYAHIVHA